MRAEKMSSFIDNVTCVLQSPSCLATSIYCNIPCPMLYSARHKQIYLTCERRHFTKWSLPTCAGNFGGELEKRKKRWMSQSITFDILVLRRI